MGFFSSLLGSFGIATIAFICVFGLVAVGIVAAIVGGIVWGLRKGKVRVVMGERNFDDFGRYGGGCLVLSFWMAKPDYRVLGDQQQAAHPGDAQLVVDRGWRDRPSVSPDVTANTI